MKNKCNGVMFSIDTNDYMWFYNIYKGDAFDVT